MSPLRFRAWHVIEKTMFPVEMLEICGDGSVYVNEVDCTSDVQIMQSTGLQDKNGKEIFEGDLIREGSYPPRLVVWDEDKLSFRSSIGGMTFKLKSTETVIGNICENPELLPPSI